MSLVLLFHYLLLNMFRMLVHPSSGACYLLWIYFMCCIALVRCVLVLLFGSAGVVWYPYAGWCPKHVETEVDNEHLIVTSCWFFLSLSSHFAHDARSQEPKNSNHASSQNRRLILFFLTLSDKYQSELNLGHTSGNRCLVYRTNMLLHIRKKACFCKHLKLDRPNIRNA